MEIKGKIGFGRVGIGGEGCFQKEGWAGGKTDRVHVISTTRFHQGFSIIIVHISFVPVVQPEWETHQVP